MRSLTVALANALAAENVIPILFVELDFVSGFLRLNTGVSSYTLGGHTFTATGALGKVDAIDESSELQAYGIKLTLSGVPNTLCAVALGEVYQGRAVRIWTGALNANHTLIADPILTFAGRMDNMQIELGEESAVIQLSAENRLADWDRPRVRRYNDADQQAEYPGDLGFQFVAQMVDKTIFWGKVSTI